MRRLLLFLKGIFMGIADVIPGVSGGTIALIVGIYRELVRTISNFHLRWIAPCFGGFSKVRNRRTGERCKTSCRH